MPKIPSDINRFLSKVKQGLATTLKGNLCGIYVYGSLTYGGFRLKNSDIDCVVVTNKTLGRKELGALNKWYKKLLKENRRLGKRLEMSYAVRDNLISTAAPKAPRFYRGKFNQKESDLDANSAIIWLNLKESGITVYGPSPKILVPHLYSSTLQKALRKVFDHMRQQPGKYLREDWSKVYVILTYCRILYTLRTEKVTSKQRAAELCLVNLPKQYNSLINRAIKSFVAGPDWKRLLRPIQGINKDSRNEIISFGNYVSKQLRGNPRA